MLRCTLAAALLFTAASGCATASEADGTFTDLDAGGTFTDLDAGGTDLGAPEDILPARTDVGAEVSVDVPVDRPSGEVGSGTCVEGTTRGCYTGLPATRGVGLCADGFQRCVGARWGVQCNGETRPQGEVCNTIDDDCDGAVDNIQGAQCYTGPMATRGVGVCHEGMQRCEGGSTPLCVGQVVPRTAEICANGLDDNCNGTRDEGCP